MGIQNGVKWWKCSLRMVNKPCCEQVRELTQLGVNPWCRKMISEDVFTARVAIHFATQCSS